MGAKFSKAVRRPPTATGTAAASPPGTKSRDHFHTSQMEGEGCQDMSLRSLNNSDSPSARDVHGTFDAGTLAGDFNTSEAAADTETLQRALPDHQAGREAILTSGTDTTTLHEPAERATNGEMSEQVSDETAPAVAEGTVQDPSSQASSSSSGSEEVRLQCIICCEQFPEAEEHRTVIRPCKPCGSLFCSFCIRKMFVEATQNISRMPPRCCVQMQLHVAKPFLSEEELGAFREKFEEWRTENPLYCPVPTCSVFISNRLLPKRAGGRVGGTEEKGKQRVDSVIGTPDSPVVSCPSCSASICIQCRQLTHPNTMCAKLEFGVDEQTAELLKSWGYKKCPKCGNGVRRMFGCNHMECLCGAHWCWVCQDPMDECNGECYEEDDHYDSDDEDEVEVPAPVAETQIVVNDDNREGAEAPTTAAPDVQTQPTQESTTSAPLPAPVPVPDRPRRPRNLDARSRHYWEDAGLNFGDEPSDEIQDRAWECSHSFSTAKAGYEEALLKAPTATGMECSRCWCTVYPEMELPNSVNAGGARMVSGISARFGGRGRGRGRGLIRRGGAVAPRMMDGRPPTMPWMHMTMPPPPGFSIPNPSPQPSQPAQRPYIAVVDTYGNSITTTEINIPDRRVSFETPRPTHVDLDTAMDVYSSSMPNTQPSHISLFGKEQGSREQFSFAYECSGCSMLVCENCKKELLTEQAELI